MINSRRVVALVGLSIVLVAGWMALVPGEFAPRADAEPPQAGQQDMQANLDQAVTSIVAAAEQGMQTAQGDEAILHRVDYSIEALRILSMLGASDTDAQAAKLLDAAESKVSPEAAEVVIRMRLARSLQQWSDLNKDQRQAAMDRFVADVKKVGLSPGLADVVLRLADSIETEGHGEVLGSALSQLVPEFKKSSEPVIQRRATIVEGIARRLSLTGQPLELNGKLLDGSDFDWDSYRGKVVLVDFFANWCGVCKQEVPIVRQAHRAYGGKGFEVVGVSVDEQPQMAEAFRRQTGFQFPTIFDDAGKVSLATKYGVTTLPRAILVDQQGNVVDTVARGERLFQSLSELLGPPGGALGQLDGIDTSGDSETVTDPNVEPAAFEEATETPPAEGVEAAAPEVPAE